MNSSPSSGYNPRSLTVTAYAKRITKSKKKFLRWLNKHHPKVLKKALDDAGLDRSDVGLSGLSAQNPAGPGTTSTNGNGNGNGGKAWYDEILDVVPSAANAYLGYKQQKELVELNEERARQGMDPLDTMPPIKVEGEAGPETRQAMQQAMRDTAMTYLPWVAGGIILFVLTRPKPQRRRKR